MPDDKNTVRGPETERRYRKIALWVIIAAVFSLLVCFCGYVLGWDSVLDWAVVALPVAGGLAAWFVPIKDSSRRHKFVLAIGCLALSTLIYLQQDRTRRAHSRELSNLPTRGDLAKLPTANEIVQELLKRGWPLNSKVDNKDRPRMTPPAIPTSSVPGGRAPVVKSEIPEIRENNGVVNAASFEPVVAPGSLASLSGAKLGSAVASVSVPLPTSLNSVSVRVNGILAPLQFVSPSQVTFQVPYETTLGDANLVVTVNGRPSKVAHVKVAPAAPGIFVLVANHAAAVNQNGIIVDSGHPARPGDLVTIYATGLGLLDRPIPSGASAPTIEPLARTKVTPTLSIGGKSVGVLFAGATPGYAGLEQVLVTIPPNLGAGEYPVVIRQGAQSSNSPIISLAQ